MNPLLPPLNTAKSEVTRIAASMFLKEFLMVPTLQKHASCHRFLLNHGKEFVNHMNMVLHALNDQEAEIK